MGNICQKNKAHLYEPINGEDSFSYQYGGQSRYTILENEKTNKEIEILKMHIVNLHFKLLNMDVDCKYEDIEISEWYDKKD